MTKVPGAGSVERALRGVKREIKSSLKHIHQHAAKLLSKGNYAGAQVLVDVARAVNGFEAEVETLFDKWRSVRGNAGGAGGSREKTPLWGYYKLILQALMSADGPATTGELVAKLEPIVGKTLRPSDFETLSDGRPRWQVMVKRARRHMVKEGFVEADSGGEWRITSAGRRAASGRGPAK